MQTINSCCNCFCKVPTAPIPNFGKHLCSHLCKIFEAKPYQGQDPFKAKYVFIGKDANWPFYICSQPPNSDIQEYLNDGVSFWKKHLIHHPFMKYVSINGGGSDYHSKFRKLFRFNICNCDKISKGINYLAQIDSNIVNKFAHEVSFVEILNTPTFGGSTSNPKLYKNLCDEIHLEKYILPLLLLCDKNQQSYDDIYNIIDFSQKSNKLIFIPKTSYIYLKNNFPSLFGNLLDVSKIKKDIIAITQGENCPLIVLHTHFSASISDEYLCQLSKLLN